MRFVDHLGHYNPRTDPPTVVIDEEKALKWLRQGAQPSDAVRQLLRTLVRWKESKLSLRLRLRLNERAGRIHSEVDSL